MDAIDRVLATADRAWRAYGVGPADRAALAADLRLDLRAAADDGVGPDRMLGTDVAGFARRLADEAGVRREPPELARLLGTALVGAALGAALGRVLLELLAPLFYRLSDPLAEMPVQVAVCLYYGPPAALVVAGAATTVWFRLRDLPRIGSTVRAMCLLLPLAGILVTPITMGLAWTMDYSIAPFPVLAEATLVLGALAGATVLARRWALRERREPGRRPVRPAEART